MFERAWDIIADQDPVEVVLRFAPSVAARVQEARWHPSQQVTAEADGSLTWRATVAGTIEVRLWVLSWGDDVEVLEPAALRDDVAATVRAGRRALRGGGRRLMPRHPFVAVNLISDPIHGYIELTKRLAAAESARRRAARRGSAAEEDLLDTPWVQRLRRISQLQSARWVFPTAEHSRFTHGLGVMHEAGLWGRSLYPSLAASSLRCRRRPRPVRGAGRRDAPGRRAPPRRRPRAVRPLLRRARPVALRRAAGRAPARRARR